MVIASTTSIVIGLTWGGVVYAWSSARVLVPLILGIVGLLGFFVYEARWATNPMVRIFVSLERIYSYHMAGSDLTLAEPHERERVGVLCGLSFTGRTDVQYFSYIQTFVHPLVALTLICA